MNKTLLWLGIGLGAAWMARAMIRARRHLDLRNRTVLITGGSRGLGLVLARESIAQRAKVAICARDPEELERARRDLLRFPDAIVHAVQCDVREQAQVEAMIRAVEQQFGRIDVLINNAAVIQVGPLESMTLADFEEAMRTNFWGPLHVTLAVLPLMRRQRLGRIVNISSIGGKISVPHLLPYCASKFALTGLSEGLRVELAKDNILVTTVCPHLMRTGSPVNATFKGRHREEYAWFSIGDSLSLLSMSAEAAARSIIDAARHGDAELILTLQANVATRLQALFPGLGAEILTLVNGLLPQPGGLGTHGVKGKDSFSEASPSWWSSLGDQAAAENNQLS